MNNPKGSMKEINSGIRDGLLAMAGNLDGNLLVSKSTQLMNQKLKLEGQRKNDRRNELKKEISLFDSKTPKLARSLNSEPAGIDLPTCLPFDVVDAHRTFVESMRQSSMMRREFNSVKNMQNLDALTSPSVSSTPNRNQTQLKRNKAISEKQLGRSISKTNIQQNDRDIFLSGDDDCETDNNEITPSKKDLKRNKIKSGKESDRSTSKTRVDQNGRDIILSSDDDCETDNNEGATTQQVIKRNKEKLERETGRNRSNISIKQNGRDTISSSDDDCERDTEGALSRKELKRNKVKSERELRRTTSKNSMQRNDREIIGSSDDDYERDNKVTLSRKDLKRNKVKSERELRRTTSKNSMQPDREIVGSSDDDGIRDNDVMLSKNQVKLNKELVRSTSKTFMQQSDRDTVVSSDDDCERDNEMIHSKKQAKRSNPKSERELGRNSSKTSMSNDQRERDNEVIESKQRTTKSGTPWTPQVSSRTLELLNDPSSALSAESNALLSNFFSPAKTPRQAVSRRLESPKRVGSSPEERKSPKKKSSSRASPSPTANDESPNQKNAPQIPIASSFSGGSPSSSTPNGQSEGSKARHRSKMTDNQHEIHLNGKNSNDTDNYKTPKPHRDVIREFKPKSSTRRSSKDRSQERHKTKEKVCDDATHAVTKNLQLRDESKTPRSARDSSNESSKATTHTVQTNQSDRPKEIVVENNDIDLIPKYPTIASIYNPNEDNGTKGTPSKKSPKFRSRTYSVDDSLFMRETREPVDPVTKEKKDLSSGSHHQVNEYKNHATLPVTSNSSELENIHMHHDDEPNSPLKSKQPQSISLSKRISKHADKKAPDHETCSKGTSSTNTTKSSKTRRRSESIQHININVNRSDKQKSPISAKQHQPASLSKRLSEHASITSYDHETCSKGTVSTCTTKSSKARRSASIQHIGGLDGLGGKNASTTMHMVIPSTKHQNTSSGVVLSPTRRALSATKAGREKPSPDVFLSKAQLGRTYSMPHSNVVPVDNYDAKNREYDMHLDCDDNFDPTEWNPNDDQNDESKELFVLATPKINRNDRIKISPSKQKKTYDRKKSLES